jgi:NADPH:quinone reductase-like Zn-dependent oxidoreductase
MGRGALAERICVPAALLAPAPDELGWAAASALPVSALTARLLVDAAEVTEGDVVLVTAAAGMVGGLAVELARGRGATVIGAVRARDATEATKLRADAIVDTGDLEAQVLERWPDGVTTCLDTVGIRGALACVRDGGRFATTQPSSVPEAERGIEPGVVQVQPDGAALAPLAEQAAAGELTVRVAQTLPLEEFRRGYELLGRGGLRGKVVLTL